MVRPGAAIVNSSGTYAFVDVKIKPSATPGSYPLILETPGGTVKVPFQINRKLEQKSHFQGITSDDVIYLIMTDRFSNGDPSNDAPAGSPAEANSRTNPRAYHGGDFRGIINHLDYLKDLGVTAIWLTPWYDNSNGVSHCDKPWCPSTYYHGYHAMDYYSVEDHFGDLATLRELVEKAHSRGLKVIQDQVANHVGLDHPWVKDPPLRDWFNGTPASHLKNPFRADFLLSPHASDLDRKPTLDGWFSDDLPDLNQNEPEVATYEIQNALWWVGITGIDAIREDTIQYMPRFFIRELNLALTREFPRMWMVGEVFDFNPVHTAFFIGGHNGWDGIDTKLASDFDFPLWNVSRHVFTNKEPASALRETLKNDGLYPNPGALTTMLNNHDVPRFMGLEGATIEGAMLHTAFMLSVRGIPQLYYGEEMAMPGGADPDNRRDFPGGFSGDMRNAFSPSGRTADEERMFRWTQEWLAFRRKHPALRDGALIDLYFDDDAYLFLRRDKNEKIMLAFNRAKSAKTILVNASACDALPGQKPLPVLGNASVTTDDGQYAIELPAQSAVALEFR
jgi:glycosidase